MVERWTYDRLTTKVDKNGRFEHVYTGFSNTSIVPVSGVKAFSMRYYNDDLVTWMPSKTLITYGYQSSAIKARINSVLGSGMGITFQAGEWVLTVTGKSTVRKYLCKSGMAIHTSGAVTGAGNYEKWWAKVHPAQLALSRAGARRRYWERMRNLAVRPPLGGAPKHPTLTVKRILGEKNTTIRMLMARVYGIERFLKDAGATVVDAEAGYELLRFSLGPGTPPAWDQTRTMPDENIQALRMTCPSTQTEYIETVPPNVNTVREALDWRYNMPGYLDRVGQQT